MSEKPDGAHAPEPGRRPPYLSPPALQAGDEVALVSPSSHQGDGAVHMLRFAADLLAGWGLEVVNAGEEETRYLYLAGSDAQRASQFQRYYCDPAVKALFFTRGGYGAARMLPLLEREKIAAAAPKAVVGFSDATALFAYLHAVAGVSVLYGPCLAAPSFARTPPQEDELEALRRALFQPEAGPEFDVSPLPGSGWAALPVEGPLLGGSLAVLVTTLGTPWEVDTRGAILFVEDVNEAPYRIDRMLTHLRTAGKFEGLRGIVLGHFQNCDENPPGLLDEVLRDLFRGTSFPVASGLPAGHGAPNMTLPLGRTARLEGGSGGGARLIFP